MDEIETEDDTAENTPMRELTAEQLFRLAGRGLVTVCGSACCDLFYRDEAITADEDRENRQ